MTDTHEFANALGRKEIASRINVGMTAVSNAVVRGVFPAEWYFLGLRELAAEKGIDCPDHLFSKKVRSNFTSPSSAPDGR